MLELNGVFWCVMTIIGCIFSLFVILMGAVCVIFMAIDMKNDILLWNVRRKIENKRKQNTQKELNDLFTKLLSDTKQQKVKVSDVL